MERSPPEAPRSHRLVLVTEPEEIVMLGDFNDRQPARKKLLAQITSHYGLKIQSDPNAIDKAYSLKKELLASKVGENFGSDHQPLKVAFELRASFAKEFF
jgi:endonuclease/exonuclease/phosphatase (EEP) superfamily protein YafD